MHKVKLIYLFLFSSLVFGNNEDFIYMHLGGRLGNQMFQIAAGLSVAEDVGAVAIFPDLSSHPREDMALNYRYFFNKLNTSSPWNKTRFIFCEHEHFHYHPIPHQLNMEIFGYFQSERYFKHNWHKIRPMFEPSEEISAYLQKHYPDILNHPNTVGIHLRAYKLEDPRIEACFPFLTGVFYTRAAEFFPEGTLFVIFSDRPDWAKEELANFPYPHIFIENEPHYHDFYLMSQCKHQIISPSSFSWWAAYMNPYPDKIVVAPDPWFHPISGHDGTNVVPQEWIHLSWLPQ